MANLHNKTEYVILLQNLKHALNHGLVWLLDYWYEHESKKKSK